MEMMAPKVHKVLLEQLALLEQMEQMEPTV
jgi:hypothetical protein